MHRTTDSIQTLVHVDHFTLSQEKDWVPDGTRNGGAVNRVSAYRAGIELWYASWHSAISSNLYTGNHAMKMFRRISLGAAAGALAAVFVIAAPQLSQAAWWDSGWGTGNFNDYTYYENYNHYYNADWSANEWKDWW